MALVIGKPIVGRLETLQYANKKFNWSDNIIIGIGHKHAFYAWIRSKLTGKKCIYYCIDFYSPEIADNLWDSIFIWACMKMDKFLCNHCDIVWDISDRIQEGRWWYGHYKAKKVKIMPLSYPPDYFKFVEPFSKHPVYVGLSVYGKEIIPEKTFYINGKLPLRGMLEIISRHSMGISLWSREGNNYYGDPGKTKLYSACGIPVIMTDNTPYAKIIKKTKAGIVIPYDEKALLEAMKKIYANYDYYKNNVKKTWKYIDAYEIFRNTELLVK